MHLLMLLQVAHRGKEFPAQSTTFLPLEGPDGQSPSCTTCTCDPGAEGARLDRCASLMLPQVAHRGEKFPAQNTTDLPLEGHGGQNPSRTTCDQGVEGVH